MPVVTVQEVKTALAIDHSERDGEVADQVNRAIGTIEAYTGRKFGDAARTEYHAGGGPIIISAPPITTLTSVKDMVGGAQDVEVVSVDQSGIIWFQQYGQVFPEGLARYEVVYTGGDTEFPDDLKAATAALVQQGLSMPAGLSQLKEGDMQSVAEMNLQGVPGPIRAILDRYRILSV